MPALATISLSPSRNLADSPRSRLARRHSGIWLDLLGPGLAQTARRYRKMEERFDKAVSLVCIGSFTAILVHSLADFNLYIPANALVFTMTLAMAWSGAHPESAPQGDIP